MGWDEVCVLCGIRNGEAPYYWGGGTKDADDIAKEVHDAGFTDLSPAEVSAMLLKSFATTVSDADPWYKWTTDPAEAGDCIAIGHFDADYGSYTPCVHHGRALHPTGDDVAVRRVGSTSWGAIFDTVVELHDGVRIVTRRHTDCSTLWPCAGCNVWVHAACWAYLDAWLDCALPPRVGRHGASLSFAGELYEVVASRHEPQRFEQGTLPCMDYGGTLDAFFGETHQDYVLPLRRGSKHVARALSDGLRNVELVSALLKDSHAWIWVRPAIWPRASSPPTTADTLHVASHPAPQPRAAICRLPNELLPAILLHCRLEDIFALASTCRELYARVLDSDTLRPIVQLSMGVITSPLRWIMPLPSLREEWEAACGAMWSWMPVGRRGGRDTGVGEEEATIGPKLPDVPAQPTDQSSLPPLPIFEAGFPIAAFLRAYRDMDSMRSRRRRWELIKQWDVLFAKYRRDGWERDVFALPGTTWALDGDGHLKCQCQFEGAS